MKETLREFTDSRGLKIGVDRTNNLIRGVKILGTESRNGRIYLPQAIRDAVPLYEGAKVNINHHQQQLSGPRDYRDRIGVIRNVSVREGDGLFADFHFNPKHELAEQFLWDAEHAPENVGLFAQRDGPNYAKWRPNRCRKNLKSTKCRPGSRPGDDQRLVRIDRNSRRTSPYSGQQGSS